MIASNTVGYNVITLYMTASLYEASIYTSLLKITRKWTKHSTYYDVGKRGFSRTDCCEDSVNEKGFYEQATLIRRMTKLSLMKK